MKTTFKSKVYTDRPEYADFSAPHKFEAIKSIIARRLIEHKIPKSQGGSNSIKNLLMACRTCNNDGNDAKGSMTTDEGFVSKGRLTHITWAVFLLNTRKMHEEFLNEAERQKENASNEL